LTIRVVDPRLDFLRGARRRRRLFDGPLGANDDDATTTTTGRREDLVSHPAVDVTLTEQTFRQTLAARRGPSRSEGDIFEGLDRRVCSRRAA
jgi:hypothetical protein